MFLPESTTPVYGSVSGLFPSLSIQKLSHSETTCLMTVRQLDNSPLVAITTMVHTYSTSTVCRLLLHRSIPSRSGQKVIPSARMEALM